MVYRLSLPIVVHRPSSVVYPPSSIVYRPNVIRFAHKPLACFSETILMSGTTSDFFGTDRFKIRRRLGSGGMGIVYEAHDRETDKVLALKALTRTEAADIFRFKREFRALADVSHPNLVSLY